MAGGSGTRLWPLSKPYYPKQFLKMFNSTSLLQATLTRNRSFGKPTIIVSKEHKSIVLEQAQEVGVDIDLIVEPAQKNTASAAIIACLAAKAEGFDLVLLLPADHYISGEEQYLSAIAKAIAHGAGGAVAFGIKPKIASTEFGYIKTSSLITDKVYRTEKFIEKPDIVTAQGFVKQPDYFWNLGIYIFDVNFLLKEARQNLPQLFALAHASFAAAAVTIGQLELECASYTKITGISVDYALLEQLPNLMLVEVEFKWHDLGNWDSLWRVSEKDEANNHLAGNIIANEVTNSYVHSATKLTALLGLDNVVVINTEEAVFVADKSKTEEVRQIMLQASEHNRLSRPLKIKSLKPWGYYQTIDSGPFYKVKRLVIFPGEQLSLQYHHYRDEHWVIVQGSAEALIDKEVKYLSANDAIFIPRGSCHQLANIGNVELHLIEVQTGSYLAEDDIVRLSDIYDRD